MIGQRVQVFWPSEEAWYCGRVADYDPEQGYRVVYGDGDTEWLESLDDPTLVRPLEEEEEEQQQQQQQGRGNLDRDDEEQTRGGEDWGHADGDSVGQGGEEGDDVDDGPELHPEELRVYDDDNDDEREARRDDCLGIRHDQDGGGGGGHKGQPPNTEDTFSPLPSPDVAVLYKDVGSRPFHSSVPLAAPGGLAADTNLGSTFDDLHEEWTGRPASTLDDIDAIIEQRQKCEAADGQWGHESEGGGDQGEEEPEAEEAAVLEGHVGPAQGLPTTEPCVVRVLYVESPGPNILFACKTTVHQTEQCPPRGTSWEWKEGAFRFEVLPPCPGDPVKGEVVMAVSQARARGAGSTTTFLGQVVIDLASAAEPGAEKVVEGDFPLRTRKGDVLPGGGTVHVMVKVHLPRPSQPTSHLNQAAAKEEAQTTRRPPQVEPSESKHRPRTVSAANKRPPAPRKCHNAINRRKFEERLAKENKLYQERIQKIKPVVTKRRPRTSLAQPSTALRSQAAEAKDGRLSIQIPVAEGGVAESPPLPDGEALSDRIRVLQQEVAALKDAIKVGGAKVLRADTQRRNQLRAMRAMGPAANDLPPSPLPPVAEVAGAAMLPSWVPSPLLTEEALQTLKEAGNPLVEVYRDRLARRNALASKIDTFRRECERTGAKAAQLQEQINKAESSRRTYHRHDAKGAGRTQGGGVSSSSTGATDRLLKLQAEEMDLRVEIDALKSSKGTNLYNGDLQHEVHVIQDHIEQKLASIGELKGRLKTCKYDRDTAKAKYLALVTDHVHQKLTKSVAALQMAVIVASKGRQWTDFISQAALVGAKAQVARMGIPDLEGRTPP